MGGFVSKEQPRFLTKQQAADYLGISIRTLNRLIMNREIAFYKYGEGRRANVRIAQSDLLKWTAKFRNEAQSA